MLKYKFDFLIVGSGIAGLYAAQYASKFGKVGLITKTNLDISNSYNAQGGIAVALGSGDSPKKHFEDTIEAGRGLCDRDSVEILVNEGPERIHELIDMGMQFDTENGKLSFGLEGGHHHKRIIHAGGDSTGKQFVKFMLSKVLKNKNISIFENTIVLELISDTIKCYGVYAYNHKNNENVLFISDSVVLSMGGCSAIYSLSTNPHISTGDGVALAYNVGAQIADMEFLQFHPTSFYSPTGETFLISEAVRGEGAYLVNYKNERFMLGIHELAELAPRDVVSQAIFNELKSSKKNHVFLKLDHLDPVKIKKRFPFIFNECQKYGVDMTKSIPVAPAAHYMIGGIRTNVGGETNIKGLYACGEVASTGVMGANRLASNSLLECIVFGKRAINSALKNKFSEPLDKDFKFKKYKINYSKEQEFVLLKNKLSEIMTQNIGILRNEKSIKKAICEIEKIQNEFNYEDNEYFSIKLKNLITVCLLISKPALLRKESRGSHIREDYPDMNSQFKFHSVQQKGQEVKFIPVR